MITVPVRRDQMVDLYEAGILDGGHDAARVPDCGWAAISRVDEHGLAGRRYEQRRVPTLHVHDIDVQRLTCAGLGGADARRREPKNQRNHHLAHCVTLLVLTDGTLQCSTHCSSAPTLSNTLGPWRDFIVEDSS